MITLTHAFGLSAEPFAQDIPTDKLFPLPGLKGFLDRFDYAVNIGAVSVITGEVGSGKSTSLRAAAARLHPSQYTIIPVVATTGSVLEFLRQISLELGARRPIPIPSPGSWEQFVRPCRTSPQKSNDRSSLSMRLIS